MSRARMIAILGTPERPAASLADRAAALMEPAGGLRLILAPDPAAPVFALALSHAARPELALHEAADGALTVIDGPVFAIEGETARPPGEGLADAVDALWRRRDVAALVRLNGQAAVLRYDPALRELVVARDRFGFAPVFVSEIEGCSVVSSDLTSLVHLGADRALDPRAVDMLLGSGYVPAPWTYLRAVEKLAPAHALRLRSGTRRCPPFRYDRPTAQPHVTLGPAARDARIDVELTRAVAHRLPPVGPVGLLLSGGVDSALLLAIARRRLGREVHAFTFHYGDYAGEFNEGDRAAALASHFGARHERIACNPRDIADELPRILAAYGEPLSYGLHSAMLHRVLASGLTTFLTGGGADEFEIDNSGRVSERIEAWPRPVRALAWTAFDGLSPLLPAMARRGYALRWAARHGLPSVLYPPQCPDPDRRRLFSDRAAFDAGLAEQIALYREMVRDYAGEGPIDRWRLLGMQFFSAECMNFWNTAWGRDLGVNVNDPYFDPGLVHAMLQMSADGFGKRRLRVFAETLLPKAAARARKIPQTIPIGQWLRGPLRDLMRAHLTSRNLGDLFDVAELDRLMTAHEQGATRHTWLLWSLIALSAWRETVLAPAPNARSRRPGLRLAAGGRS